MEFLPQSWPSVFTLETPLLELIVRGTVLYFGILILMRLMPRRTGGELAMMDLVFLLLITNAASHALGAYNAVADGRRIDHDRDVDGMELPAQFPQLSCAVH